MSFLETFDRDYAGLLANRATGFRAIFELLELADANRYLILETGTLRLLDNWAGDGQSTRLFDAFVNFHDGAVFSVDIDPKAVAVARAAVSARTHCVCADSVAFLRDVSRMAPGGFDLVYLDSLDLDVNNPAPSAFHHIKELLALGTLAAGDDRGHRRQPRGRRRGDRQGPAGAGLLREHRRAADPRRLPEGVAHPLSYRPRNTGARFSTKALAASAWSALSRQRSIPYASESSASDSPPSSATFMLRLM